MDVWGTPEFVAELRAWVEGEVGPVSSLTESKRRPWAAVWRVETARGAFYAKQNCPGQAFEARLMGLLAELAPTYVVPVAAVDADRGFLLTPDQGRVFGDTADPDDLDGWVRLVVRAMELSRVVSGDAERLVAAGATRCRVPARVRTEVESLLEAVEALCLPDSLVHNDLHEHNAFDLPDGLVFFDFADAVVAQPLLGLLVPLNMMAHHLEARARRPAASAGGRRRPGGVVGPGPAARAPLRPPRRAPARSARPRGVLVPGRPRLHRRSSSRSSGTRPRSGSTG